MVLPNYTTTERNALTSKVAGDTIYNSTTGSIEFYDGANWIATNLIPTINSITGTILAGVASTLTLSLTNATDTVDVKYYEGGTLLATDSGVTVTSGSATSTVPSAVYGQTAGDTISISISNVDGTPSSNSISKTVVGLPTGGTITSSGGYRYHKFTSSGTFTVPSGFSLTGDYLIIAGGAGGGGGYQSGGGGAGGVVYSSGVATSAGSYSVTVGAGGSGHVSATSLATNGGNSSVASLGLTTAVGGGKPGCQDVAIGGNEYGSSGGSGGGGSHEGGLTGYSGTSGQGYAGGNGYDPAPHAGGGGGGAGGVGQTGSASKGGDGGVGTNSYSTWASATSSGDSGYFAGGGAGTYRGSNSSSGGAGGGGDWTSASVTGQSGQANTGGGGAGGRGGDYGGSNAGNGGSGGSGIVIIRYQI
jgi:hypothetical protein